MLIEKTFLPKTTLSDTKQVTKKCCELLKYNFFRLTTVLYVFLCLLCASPPPSQTSCLKALLTVNNRTIKKAKNEVSKVLKET